MEKETERKCIATGELRPVREMLRFVKAYDNSLVPDLNKKLEGRGVYVSNSRQALSKALAKNLFSKSLHQHLKIREDLVETVERILFRKGLDSLNLARKAGALVSGFEKVKEKILNNKVAFLIEAVDAGQDGADKLATLAKDLEVLKIYTGADLDKALNKTNVVHIAVLKGNMATMVYENLKKYQTFQD
jgi:hypothetical protein